MSHLVKYLPSKHDYLSSDNQHAHKKPAVCEAVCACDPMAVKAETMNP